MDLMHKRYNNDWYKKVFNILVIYRSNTFLKNF